MYDAENWHISLRDIKLPIDNDSVYVIFDPNDQNNLLTFLGELKANNVTVSFHNLNIFNVNNNKDLYMKDDYQKIIKSKNILVYLTENAVKSYSVLYECLFAYFVLNRSKFIVLLMRNVWDSMRPSLRAVLGGFYVRWCVDEFDIRTLSSKPIAAQNRL
jgi:hypothetical protein